MSPHCQDADLVPGRHIPNDYRSQNHCSSISLLTEYHPALISTAVLILQVFSSALAVESCSYLSQTSIDLQIFPCFDLL